MNKLQEGKLKKLLDKYGTACNVRIAKGYKPKKIEEKDHSKFLRIEDQMKLIKQKYCIGLSNENLPEIKRYRELEKEQKENCIKTSYYLVSEDDRYFEIPKMVYDFYAKQATN